MRILAPIRRYGGRRSSSASTVRTEPPQTPCCSGKCTCGSGRPGKCSSITSPRRRRKRCGNSAHDYVEGVLQVKVEEARVVSLIFRRYLEGKGIAKICQELNRDGYRTKTGRAWASQTIANILSNPVYCGLARLNGGIKRGKHDPLIEIDTFNRVQQEMQRRIRRPDQRKADPPQLRLEDYVAQ